MIVFSRAHAISLGIFGLCPALSLAQVSKSLGVIRALSPTGVQHIPATSKASRIPHVGDLFYNHDQFLTDKKGRVLLEFHEGEGPGKNRVVVGVQSDLVINAPEFGPGTSLSLNKGSVFSHVKKKYAGSADNEFRVVTDNGVAGVRGTKFLVTFVNLRMGVAVIESIGGRGAEVRKEIFDFKDAKMVRDHQSLLVDRADVIQELSPQKLDQLPKDLLEILREDASFEGTSLSVTELSVPARPSEFRSDATRIRPSSFANQHRYLNELRNQASPAEGAERVENAINAPSVNDGVARRPAALGGVKSDNRLNLAEVEKALKRRQGAVEKMPATRLQVDVSKAPLSDINGIGATVPLQNGADPALQQRSADLQARGRLALDGSEAQ